MPTTVPESILQEAVRRIVDAIQPDKIILFGSAARGEMTERSDLDLMVVKSGVDRRRTAMLLYERLIGLGIPKDIVVVHPRDLWKHRNNPFLVIYPALREGRTLYIAADRGEDDYGRENDEWPLGQPAEWILRARSNLIIASRQPEPGVCYEDLAYEAQQSVEKALKAVLIHRRLVFPYTLDISELIGALESGGVSVPRELRPAASLTNYAMESRYPSRSGDIVTRQMWEEAIAIARLAVSWATDMTPSGPLPQSN